MWGVNVWYCGGWREHSRMMRRYVEPPRWWTFLFRCLAKFAVAREQEGSIHMQRLPFLARNIAET
jgi:hypothetical protein